MNTINPVFANTALIQCQETIMHFMEMTNIKEYLIGSPVLSNSVPVVPSAEENIN